jgi:hypothetical protein
MNLLKNVLTFIILIQYLAFAQESTDKNLPQLSVQQSNYIEFKNTNITASNGTITFEGKFIVLGERVYGHFDMVASSDSGKVLQKAMSQDRAWLRDQGGKLKKITLSMNVSAPAKVEVSFHEMRLHPESGACK